MPCIAGIVLLTLAAFAAAPQQRGTQPIESFFGTINEVTNANAQMVEIHLKAGNKRLQVRLGPASFLNEFEFTLKDGQDISVRGYRVMEDGREILMAVEIGLQYRKLNLRNDRGVPLW